MIEDETSFPNVVHSDGYSTGHLDDLGEGYGFRKVRARPRRSARSAPTRSCCRRATRPTPTSTRSRRSSTSCTPATSRWSSATAPSSQLEPGSFVRVDPTTVRRLRNFGYEDAVVLAIGGKDGYVGRDGKPPEGEARAPAVRSTAEAAARRGAATERAAGTISAWRSSTQQRVARIPAYPAASAYALPEDVALLASNEAPDPPLPQVVEAINARPRRAQPLPGPDERAPARRAVGPLRRARGADRDRQRLLRRAAGARRGAARARRRARLRVAVVQRLPAPRGRLGRDRRPRAARRERPPRPRGDARGDHGRHAARDRLQPEQPDEHRGRRRPRSPTSSRASRATSACSSTRPTASSTRSTTPTRRCRCSRTHPNLILLRTFSKIYGLAGLRVGFALCGSAETVTAVNQVRQPFFCSAAAQAAATEALRHQDAVAERVERAIVARVEIEDAARRRSA